MEDLGACQLCGRPIWPYRAAPIELSDQLGTVIRAHRGCRAKRERARRAESALAGLLDASASEN